MASWVDIFSFLATTIFFVGAALGAIYLVRLISTTIENTKTKLQEKGISISDKGVSVKTSKRFERSDYMDATQREFIKALGAVSFGHVAESSNQHQPVVGNGLKSQSATSFTEKDKKQ